MGSAKKKSALNKVQNGRVTKNGAGSGRGKKVIKKSDSDVEDENEDDGDGDMILDQGLASLGGRYVPPPLSRTGKRKQRRKRTN